MADDPIEPARRGRRRFFRARGVDEQTPQDAESRDLRADHARAGRTSIAEAGDRERVQLFGTLRTVTLQPRGSAPALEAELADGTGVITLVWLGRRSIRGISAGRSVSVTGRVGEHSGVRVMYNPRYELRP